MVCITASTNFILFHNAFPPLKHYRMQLEDAVLHRRLLHHVIEFNEHVTHPPSVCVVRDQLSSVVPLFSLNKTTVFV